MEQIDPAEPSEFTSRARRMGVNVMRLFMDMTPPTVQAFILEFVNRHPHNGRGVFINGVESFFQSRTRPPDVR